MCILKEVGRFIKNGASTFRDASQGHYKQNSEAISEIRKEILEKDRNRNDDKRNLMEDRKNVEGDVRRSFNEIVRTKISEVAYNDTFATDTELICGLISYFFEESEDTEVGLYQVSLVYYDVDEKTGKTKSSNSTIYVPAYSSSEAIENIRTYLKRAGETREYTIRNVKYDKAQSVMVTPETHQNNIRV